MPRWASRITLKITDVRVERVQDISNEDVEAEGIYNGAHINNCCMSGCAFHPDAGCSCGNNSYQEDYEILWNSINNNWNENPYVWVIEFEVIHKNIDEFIPKHLEVTEDARN